MASRVIRRPKRESVLSFKRLGTTASRTGYGYLKCIKCAAATNRWTIESGSRGKVIFLFSTLFLSRHIGKSALAFVCGMKREASRVSVRAQSRKSTQALFIVFATLLLDRKMHVEDSLFRSFFIDYFV